MTTIGRRTSIRRPTRASGTVHSPSGDRPERRPDPKAPTAPVLFRWVFAGLMTVLAVGLSLPLPASAQSSGASAALALSVDDLRAFEPRAIGPTSTGGRIHDVEALPDDPSVLWVAAASGGLWKSTNRGVTWRQVFGQAGQEIAPGPVDPAPRTGSLGDLALAPSNPQILYLGTGEQNNRNSTSWGQGIYRSDDGGESWRHLGLTETRHIGRVVVHPHDPETAWVAAQGNLWAPSEHRGVYRTSDGGESWERVLAVDTLTGATDLVLDPRDPDVLYAATYQRLRTPWGFNGGGPGSALWKSEDGGDSWERLTNDLPRGDKGRIGLAIAASDPDVVYATIEHAEESGLYRSDDAGASWERVNPLNPRPMYYSHIFVDPVDEDRIYLLATNAYRSEDGGRSFTEIARASVYDVGIHSDHHALWIDPADPDHLFLGGDGGMHESYDRGRTFRKFMNLQIAQVYALDVDGRDPYRVYVGMQDNHSFHGPSRTRRWEGILEDDWLQHGFGDGMYQAVDRTDFRNAYAARQFGFFYRHDPVSGDLLRIQPTDPGDATSAGAGSLRWDWLAPLVVSRHEPTTVYVGSNRLHISGDRGESWLPTEDLTRDIDRDTLEIMGVRGSEITLSRHDGEAGFSELTTISESPVDPRVLWVGADDGSVRVSRDGGTSWTEVGGRLPVRDGAGAGGADGDDSSHPRAGSYISRVTASAEGTAVAYLAVDDHRRGDFRPYLYRTDDFGASWTALHDGLPEGSVNDVVELPSDPRVLFVGTEGGLHVSPDRGRSWVPMPGLPTTSFDDLVVHFRDQDLVIGTHGRGVWIVDDVRPLGGWTPEVVESEAHLFPVRDGTLEIYPKNTSYRGHEAWPGENPPEGVPLTWRIGVGAEEVRIEIYRVGTAGAADGLGLESPVRSFLVDGSAGLHRIWWDLRHGLGPGTEEYSPWDPVDPLLLRPTERRGPRVSPGRYTAVLRAGEATAQQTFRVEPDPDQSLTTDDYLDRERFLLELLALERRGKAVVRELEELQEAAEEGSAEGLRLGSATSSATLAVETLEGLYSDLVGSGALHGTLHPPTVDMREELDDARGRILRAEETRDEVIRAAA